MAMGVAAQGAAAQEQDRRLGNWVETKVSASYQGLRRSFEDLGGGITRVNIAINDKGAALSSAELKCDGRPYPVLGSDRQPTETTLSCRTLNASTTEFTFVRSGGDSWIKSTGTERVSEDGEKMFVSAVQTDARGQVVERIERVFVRKR
ncbi:MAG TPA: hypothetical protein VMS40_25165 [Vicinamibacterales bacterium]|nr:hypothetical protein [Vicinamibacterales bacterium]